jgi:hypothetical protein
MVTVRMQADLKLQVGTRLLYNCPAMSPEDHKSDAFFKKYRGREATVAGFVTEEVLPFNRIGRKPGLYYNNRQLRIQFDGDTEVHDKLNLNHFVVVGPADLVPGRADDFVSDLPEDPTFYPLDIVMKSDDLLAVPQMVASLQHNQRGLLQFELSDTEEVKQARLQKDRSDRDQAREEGRWVPALSLRSGEIADASELRLISRGNGYHLYHDHTKMSFASTEEELSFWVLDGISKVVHMNERWWFPLKRAQEIIASGAGDIIIESVHATRDDDTCEVLRLHDLFGQHRGRIRALADGVVVSVAKPMRDPFKSLVGMMARR